MYAKISTFLKKIWKAIARGWKNPSVETVSASQFGLAVGRIVGLSWLGAGLLFGGFIPSAAIIFAYVIWDAWTSRHVFRWMTAAMTRLPRDRDVRMSGLAFAFTTPQTAPTPTAA